MAALAGNPFFVAAPTLDHLRPTFAIGFVLARYPSTLPAIESKELNVKLIVVALSRTFVLPLSLFDLKLDALDHTTILAGFSFYCLYLSLFYMILAMIVLIITSLF